MFVAVVVVCFWRSSWLAFLILTYYIKLMHQFLTPLSYLLWRLSYRSYRIFWKRLFAKNNFWVFLSVPHLLDNYAKIVDGRGRNFMCHRTLPSRLVWVHPGRNCRKTNGWKDEKKRKPIFSKTLTSFIQSQAAIHELQVRISQWSQLEMPKPSLFHWLQNEVWNQRHEEFQN